MDLTHVDAQGKAVMVDVSGKPRVRRTATAGGRILLKKETVDLIRSNLIQKGDVLAVARVAGITAAKKTWELIPLCHNIAIDQVRVDFQLLENAVEISATAVCTDKTGIEMEVLTAVSVAALTIYDMCKAVDRDMRITEIRLVEKTKEPVEDAAGRADRPAAEGGQGGPAGRGEFSVLSVNISTRKGVRKQPIERGILRAGHGLEGDAHAGAWHRQVSLLAGEDIDTMRGRGIELNYGDFAENITTRGVDLGALPIGTHLYLGGAVLEITQIGKECHHDCAIYQAVGDCVMPRRGVFARVIQGGEVSRDVRGHYDL